MSLATPIYWMADMQASTSVISGYISSLMLMFGGVATLVATFFLITSGFQYMTSRGEPEKLEHAKKVMRNALVGLVIVFAAGTLTAILTHAYSSSANTTTQSFPTFNAIETPSDGFSITDLLIKAIVGLFKNIIQAAAVPFLKALDFFTHATPLMAQNSGVFSMWMVMVGIADALFVLLIGILGFHVMSASSLGFEEIELRHMLPQLALGFLLINTSIFAIDMIVELSNIMIKAVEAAFSTTGVWDVLTLIVNKADGLGLAALMVMIVFVILSVILLVYYVTRLVTLYIGAVMSPIVILLALLPGFKDFAWTAMKTYITTIFVLFIHVVVLQLAASLFGTALGGGIDPITGLPTPPNSLMAMILGIATLLTIIKTQGFLMQIAFVSTGPRAMRKLSGQFMNGMSYTAGKIRSGGSRQLATDTGSGGSNSNRSSGSSSSKSRRVSNNVREYEE
jgi:Type IV secretion system pilin/TrbL/VirB6 plasmid conjugal transfer protein